jgi:hypothetical protein
MKKHLCLTCKHYKAWAESRPWGSTVAYEHFEECEVEAPEFVIEQEVVAECKSYEEVE